MNRKMTENVRDAFELAEECAYELADEPIRCVRMALETGRPEEISKELLEQFKLRIQELAGAVCKECPEKKAANTLGRTMTRHENLVRQLAELFVKALGGKALVEAGTVSNSSAVFLTLQELRVLTWREYYSHELEEDFYIMREYNAVFSYSILREACSLAYELMEEKKD